MSNKHIDIRVSVWERYHFSDNADMDKIAKDLKEGKVEVGEIIEESLGFVESEILNDTIEYDDNSIIEVYEDGDCLYAGDYPENSCKK